jgi:hypothetical protein
VIKIKLIIPCWPSFEYAAQKCLRKSLEDLGQVDVGNYAIQIIKMTNPYISMARNEGISESKQKKQVISDCDYCLFVDSDQGFVFDNIKALVDADKLIVGGAIPYRKERVDRVKYYCGGNFHLGLPGFINSYVERTQRGIVKVEWIGGGFLLVRAEVFSKIEYPWFFRGVLDNVDTAHEFSEDLGFCIRCSKANIPIYMHCDLSPKLIHEQDIKSSIERKE